MKHLFQHFFYTFFVRPWLRFIIGVRFENIEAFQKADQFIAVANHNSHFDTVSIMAALPNHKRAKTRAVAAADYFGKSNFTGLLMSLFFNSILIKRKREQGEVSAIDILDEHLKKGDSLILFPEGSRGRPGVISDFKKGIAILLQRNPNIPFIPVYLDGFGRVLPKDSFLILPLVCKVRFGNPAIAQRHDTDALLEEVKEAIFSLKNEDERDRNHF
ncbi:MAG: 1-acyl-sn-glycerol-3-phosphate acyltransferase [Lewinellaceae bacterium]|nr:1-acyl-sn-glycerol-3-phosphate acyltransferase [Lewinellaceae bacterium]